MRVRSTFGRFQEWAAGAVFRADGAGDFRIYVAIMGWVAILVFLEARECVRAAHKLAPCINHAHSNSPFCPFRVASASICGADATVAVVRGDHHHSRRYARARATMRQQARAQRVLELRSRRGCSRPLPWRGRAENGLVRTPQVPTMAENDFSAATATFLPFFESFKGCSRRSNPFSVVCARSLLAHIRPSDPPFHALTPALCPP